MNPLGKARSGYDQGRSDLGERVRQSRSAAIFYSLPAYFLTTRTRVDEERLLSPVIRVGASRLRSGSREDVLGTRIRDSLGGTGCSFVWAGTFSRRGDEHPA
jgi:hypothetical protein